MKPAWRSESLYERARQACLANIAARLTKCLHNFSTFQFSSFSLFDVLKCALQVNTVAKRLPVLFTVDETDVCLFETFLRGNTGLSRSTGKDLGSTLYEVTM